MSETNDVTTIGREAAFGHKESIDRLLSLLLKELKRAARGQLRQRPAGGMLNTTGLVHEAYLKLVDQARVEWKDRKHFMALASRAMRQILVNYFHRQRAQKRGGGRDRVTLQEGTIPIDERSERLLALDEALAELARTEERLAQVVMYRFFGGMSHKAIAEVLGLSPRTIRRDWRTAKAWLARQLAEEEGN